MKIIILCTGNTCRSQMAEYFLKSLDSSLEVVSAGTVPGERVHPKGIAVMKEKGIDMSNGTPKPVTAFTAVAFDYLVTVCNGAKETCPVFTGEVKHRFHIGFDDPAEATGTDEEITAFFRRVRDEIFRDFTNFYNTNLIP